LDLGNGQDGVFVSNGASNNTIGGLTAGARNVISGNNQNGVHIAGTGTLGNVVQGNFIGTNADGTTALSNGRDGVLIAGGSPNNTIGGTAADAGNLMSGNASIGISIESATGNVVQGNKIGTDATGDVVLGNGTGVRLEGPGNTIGGALAGARNFIAGN